MELYKNYCVTYEYDHTRNLFKEAWRQGASETVFRDIITTFVRLFAETKAEYSPDRDLPCLIDLRQFDVLPPTVLEWVAHQMAPAFYEAGIRRMAFVMPEDNLARLNVEDYFRECSKNEHVYPIERRGFEDEPEAVKWLLSVTA